MYSPYTDATAQRCQRCGMPLPFQDGYCRNCGYVNTPTQPNSTVAPSPSGMSWGEGTPQTAYGPNQNGGQQWSQYSGQSSFNDSFGGTAVPQQPFGPPNQSLSSPSQPSLSPNNFYTASAGSAAVPQQPFGPPSQPSLNPNNFYTASAPQQPFYPQASPQPMPDGFPLGNMNSYSSAGFLQASGQQMMGGLQAAGMSQPYQPAGFAQPLEKKNRPKVGLIIGVVVLLLMVVGGGIFGYLYVSKFHSSPSVQKTPTVAPTPTPKGNPLFSDSFTNNKDNWDTTSKAGAFSVKIGGGSLVLEDDNNKLLWELVPGGKNYGDFFLTVDAILSKGTPSNGYGIYIRGASNQSAEIATYYRFELYGDGTFAIFKGTVDATGTSKSNVLVDYTTSSAILKQGQVNHIAISAKGSTMSLLVNGQTLKIVTDNTYASGSVALFVSNLPNTSPGAQATFSNFNIYPAQA